MALKLKITKAVFDKLPKDVQTEYKAEGDDFVLDVEGIEDTSALKAAKDRERDAANAAKKQLKEVEAQLAAITEERDGMLAGSIPKTDVEKLKTSYETKLAAKEKELSGQIEGLNSQLQTMLVDNVATSMAAKISTSPELIMPHIKSRLKVDKSADGKFVTSVIDKTGAPSASTVEDLEKEFVANPAFAPIITGSKASGGGAGGGSGGGGAPAKIDWSKNPSAKEVAASLRASKGLPEVPKE